MPRLFRTLPLAAALAWVLAPAARAGEYPHLLLGNPSKATDYPKDRDNYLLKKDAFALSYNNARGTPNWVSWRLVKDDLGKVARKQFHPDADLPRTFRHVTPREYTNSGFDRGHVCPHGDRAGSDAGSTATFAMTNMLPQAPELNQGPWADLEDYCRHLVAREDRRLYIVSGPVGVGGTGHDGLKETIGGGKVTVPAQCWKVVMSLPENGDEDDVGKVFGRTRIIAVVMPNSTHVKRDWAGYRTSVRHVEKLTGLTFFDRVPAETIGPLKEKEDEVLVKPVKSRKRTTDD